MYPRRRELDSRTDAWAVSDWANYTDDRGLESKAVWLENQPILHASDYRGLGEAPQPHIKIPETHPPLCDLRTESGESIIMMLVGTQPPNIPKGGSLAAQKHPSAKPWCDPSLTQWCRVSPQPAEGLTPASEGLDRGPRHFLPPAAEPARTLGHRGACSLCSAGPAHINPDSCMSG